MLSTLLEENGFRFCSAVLVSFSAGSVPTRAFSPAYTWFEMGYMGGEEHSCLMVLPWAANTSPHTQFQKGLELSRQALIPPEWPLLPAKEHHQHTHTSNVGTARSVPRLA